MPMVDGTDFYMFRSYEPGREAYVTFLANYLPLQQPYGGPNFFNLDAHAVYSIQVDNVGNGTPHLTFAFHFTTDYKNKTVNAGGKSIPVPLLNIAPVGPGVLNVTQSYSIDVINNGVHMPAENLSLGGTTFIKPADNIGTKSIPEYEAYLAPFIFQVKIPGCPTAGRVFVGQRKEGFVADLGGIFDLVNLNPAGPRDGNPNSLSDKNVTTIALEVPIACLRNSYDPVIGAYTTASLLSGQQLTQVSRLGMPLVNELVIGIPDKDKFNASSPADDAQFLSYVTNHRFPSC